MAKKKNIPPKIIIKLPYFWILSRTYLFKRQVQCKSKLVFSKDKFNI